MPPGGDGYRVTPETLAQAAADLERVSGELATARDHLNDACVGVAAALGGGEAGAAFDELFSVWWNAVDAMAETTASTADATQQAAVLYEHADRVAMPPPPGPPPPPAPPACRPSWLNLNPCPVTA